MRIWDMHGNLWFSGTPGRSLMEKAENLIGYLDRMGIERLCSPFGVDWPEVATNQEIVDVLNRFPDRLFGLLYLRREDDVPARLEKIERWLVDGPMVGVVLGNGGICSDLEFDPVFRRVAELKPMIFQHTFLKIGGTPLHPGGGNHPLESTPQDVAIVAQRYPELPIICEHIGGDWELGVRAVRSTPNVYAGTSGFYPTAGLAEMAVRELGPERVIFGSDLPDRSIASQMAKILGSSLSAADKEAIMGENLRRLMTPFLTRKGIRI